MPKALQNVPWREIQSEYQAGKGSCTEIAEKYGVSAHAVRKRCLREKWNASKEEVVSLVQSKVVSELSRSFAEEAREWVKGTLSQTKSFRGHVSRHLEVEQKPKDLIALAHTERVADDMARRALGLAETPQVIALSSDSPEFQGQVLSQLEAVRKLVVGGKVDPKTIDIEAIVELTKEVAS